MATRTKWLLELTLGSVTLRRGKPIEFDVWEHGPFGFSTTVEISRRLSVGSTIPISINGQPATEYLVTRKEEIPAEARVFLEPVPSKPKRKARKGRR